MIVKIAESIDDRTQLFILLLEHLDLIRQLVYLANELLSVLHLPLLLVQQQLKHQLVVLIRFLLAAVVQCSDLSLQEFSVLDRGALPLVGIRLHLSRLGGLVRGVPDQVVGVRPFSRIRVVQMDQGAFGVRLLLWYGVPRGRTLAWMQGSLLQGRPLAVAAAHLLMLR